MNVTSPVPIDSANPECALSRCRCHARSTCLNQKNLTRRDVLVLKQILCTAHKLARCFRHSCPESRRNFRYIESGRTWQRAMSRDRLFQFESDSLECQFVEDLGKRTLYSGVILRLFLGSAWAVGWRKLLSNSLRASSWR